MQFLFSPARKLSDGLSYTAKFILVGILLLLPVGAMVFMLFDSSMSQSSMYLVRAVLILLLVCMYLLIGLYLSIVGTISSFVAGISRFTQGDLAARVQTSAHDEMGQVADQFNEMTKEMRRMIARVSSSASSVADAATKMVEKTQQVALISQKQTDAASNVAAAVEEMTVSIGQVAGHAGDTETVSAKASDLSAEGEKVVRDASSEMTRIADSFRHSTQEITSLGKRTEEISTIVNVIKEIADQTNLLALNAAIEAARAGEQGRGFAVVADEVRKLAERTSNATKEITTMIGNIQVSMKSAVTSMGTGAAQVMQGVELASRAGDALADINTGSKEVLEMVHNIASAVQEQSVVSNDIAQNIERISVMAHDSSSNMGQMAEEAKTLGRVSGVLKEAISLFSGGTANDAQKLVEKGAAHIAKTGREKAFADFNDPNGEFVQRDMYLFVYRTDGTVLAHGGNPGNVGKNLIDAKDPNGKPFVRERIEIVNRAGSGWQDYLFMNPETKEVKSKTSYLLKVEDMIIGCGVYK